MKVLSYTGLLLAGVLVLSSCGSETQEKPASNTGAAVSGTATVCTTNYPVYYFTSRIAGDAVDVVYPVPADEDPAYWEPEPTDIRAMQQADLLIMNGATYEKWADKVSLKESTTVYTANAFRDDWIMMADAVTHSHGPGGEHSHTGTAIITWLAMDHAEQQAEAIRDALIRIKPDQKDTFNANFDALAKDLGELDDELQTISKGKESLPLVGSHPVFQYLAADYDLTMKYVHFETSEMPDETMWANFSTMLETHPAKVMVWEAQPDEEIVAALKEKADVDSIVFNILGNTPEEGDFISVMKTNIAALRSVYTD